MNWARLIPDAPFDWSLIPLDGRKRPIDPETGELKSDWQLQSGYDIDGISALNGKVDAVGLMLGEKSGGVLQVDFDGPASPAKFQEIYGKAATDLPRTIGVTSGKESRGSRFFLVDSDWWPSLRGRKAWKDADGDICLELRWAGHQAVIAGKHPETKGYSWLANSSPADLEMATAPDWLLEPLVRTEATYEPVQPSSKDAERAVAMLQYIDPKSRMDYDSWLEIGMALHHIDSGLLTDWVDWSNQMPNFDEDECLQKWQGFADYKGQPLTIGTLHHYAKQGGYKEPKKDSQALPKFSFSHSKKAEEVDEEQDEPSVEFDSDCDSVSIAEVFQLSERLAEGRRLFTFHSLLPADLADAVEVLQRSLPTDPLSAALPLLTGYSGLFKLGTRVSSSYGFSKPANLFLGCVLRTGLAKTSIKNTLLDAPAAGVKKSMSRAHEMAMEEWKEENKGKPKDEKSPAPTPIFPHITDYTSAALYRQLHANETKGMGQLLIRDELSGLFNRMASDTKTGAGDGEAQLLELFDGDGYTGLRVADGARSFESCHVSLYGNVQPEVLKGLINGNDSTGKFARFLFCLVPARPLYLEDDDPTEKERAQYDGANLLLRAYADKVFALPPRTYSFSKEARKRFHAWFNEHQRRSILQGTPNVIAALLGKTSAHALRLAGVMHILKVAAGEADKDDLISFETVDTAMAVVDQLTQETEAFHERPSDSGDELSTIDLMRHIHELSWFSKQPVSRQDCRDKGGSSVRRELKAALYAQLTDELAHLGYGEVNRVKQSNGKKALFYTATQEMA